MGACVSREVGGNAFCFPGAREPGSQPPCAAPLQVASDGGASGDKPKPTSMRDSWLPELFETEGARIKSLNACGLIDTPAEPRFDNITT